METGNLKYLRIRFVIGLSTLFFGLLAANDRLIGHEFLESMKDEVDCCVILCDTERLHGLVGLVDMYLGWRVLKSLKDKGFGDDIRKLCDKAGKLEKVDSQRR